jgi:hypothetical protein
MPLYELLDQGIKALDTTMFSREGVRERTDLQRLLRDHIDVGEYEIRAILEDLE